MASCSAVVTALGDQVLGTGDEVAEGVVFVLLLAGAVPGFAQFAAAAHVGDGKGHAAVQQAQAGVGEPRVEAFAVGAVAVQVQRHGLAQVLAATTRLIGTWVPSAAVAHRRWLT